MKPLTRQDLRGGAMGAIRAEIISGALRPGPLYAIGKIAESLGVSATPVREALLDLQSQGLIVMVRNRGFTIRALSDAELDDLLRVRLMLEVPAMRELALLGDQVNLDDSKELCEHIFQAGQRGDITSFLAADRDLHIGLTAMLGNASLTDVVGNLRDRSRLYGLQRLSPDRIAATSREHFALVEAIEDGSATLAGELMGLHLQHVRSDWSHVAQIEEESDLVDFES